MLVRQLALKLLSATGDIDQAALIPIFHRWIQERRLERDLLIDVADYRHVENGPGVMLIASEAHYSLDTGGGTTGLRLAIKRDRPGELADKLPAALARLLLAAAALEAEPSLGGALRFDPSNLEIEVHDRLIAEPSAAFGERLASEVSDVLGPILDGFLAVEAHRDPRRPPGVTVRGVETRDLATLVDRAA